MMRYVVRERKMARDVATRRLPLLAWGNGARARHHRTRINILYPDETAILERATRGRRWRVLLRDQIGGAPQWRRHDDDWKRPNQGSVCSSASGIHLFAQGFAQGSDSAPGHMKDYRSAAVARTPGEERTIAAS